jgi:hypothetical protein
MTSLIRIFFPDFRPPSTVEDYGVRVHPVLGDEDEAELERQVVEQLERHTITA